MEWQSTQYKTFQNKLLWNENDSQNVCNVYINKDKKSIENSSLLYRNYRTTVIQKPKSGPS